MGGTGLEQVTSSLSIRSSRSRLFAPVRLSLLNAGFRFALFAASEPERTFAASIASTDQAPKPRSANFASGGSRRGLLTLLAASCNQVCLAR